MKFFETSKYFSLKKSTYINLRSIAAMGQLITINIIYFVFNFEFDLVLANSIIIIGVLSNFYLLYINKNTQLSDKTLRCRRPGIKATFSSPRTISVRLAPAAKAQAAAARPLLIECTPG